MSSIAVSERDVASSRGVQSKRTLSERLKDWCKIAICYCSLGNKTSLIDPGDRPLTTSPQRGPNDPPLDRKHSTGSHMTDHVTLSHAQSLDSSGSQIHSPTHKKTVKFSEQGGSLVTQSTIESLIDELPVELRSLEARLTTLFGNGFFNTVNEEGGNESGEDNYEEMSVEQEWAHLELKIQVSEQQLRAKISEVENMTELLRLNVNQKMTNGFLPFEFELTQYESLKSRNATYSSPPMYTHPGGYRFRVEVLPAGEGMSEGTHLSINAVSLKGDLDSILKFPVSFTVTIQILNSYMDSDHFTRDIECTYQKPNGIYEIGSEFEFIPRKRLYWDEEERTMYLRNDKIKFRVTRIVFVRQEDE